MSPASVSEGLLVWLREQYPLVRVLPDDSIAAVCPLLYTTSVITGLDRWGYARRYCYKRHEDAISVFNNLRSEDDEPEGWVARR